jgi:hypothetical protein
MREISQRVSNVGRSILAPPTGLVLARFVRTLNIDWQTPA